MKIHRFPNGAWWCCIFIWLWIVYTWLLRSVSELFNVVLLLSNIKKNQTRPPHMAFGMLLRKQFEKVQLAEGFWVLSRKKPGSSFLEAVHTSIYDFYDNAWRKWERHFQGVSLINRSHDRVPFRFWCVKPSFPWNLHIATAQTPYFFDLSDIENHCPSVWAQFFNVERSSSGREKLHEQIRKMVWIDWWKPYAEKIHV